MSDEDYETWVRGGVSPTLNAFDNATETRATVLVSFDTQFGSNANVFEDVSPTLKATQAPPSICPTPVYSFKPGQSEAAGGPFITEGVVPTLQAQNNGSTAVPAVGFYPTGGTHGVSAMNDVSPAVKVGSGVGIPSAPAVLSHMQVRRLTPVEVCRLQGFPDDWNTGLPDSARYKQMGNAVTVNVANYIACLINTAVRASA